MNDRLLALLRAGQQAWPEVPLAPEDFAADLGARLGPEGSEDPATAPEPLQAGDLYLACACARHVPQALAAFDRAYLSQVPATISHVDPSPAFADEVRQAVRVAMLVDGERPLIGDYAGRGALYSFVRIVAVRAALRLRRRRVTDGQPMGEGGPVRDLPGPALGPELAHIKARYQAEFKDALEQAMAALSGQERNVLRLQTVAGLNGRQIADLYKVSPGTVSRWLTAARESLLTGTRRRLQERLRLTPEEFHSLAGVLVSQIDLSLSRILQEDPER